MLAHSLLLNGKVHPGDRLGLTYSRGRGINGLLTGDYSDADRMKKALYRNDLLH